MSETRIRAGQDDPYKLNRFVSAQERIYDRALREIRHGEKQTHWMWFIFPQIEGLGSSITSRRYAIKSVDEAQQYLNHPVLGPRLLECASAVLAVEGRSASEIFGYPDDLKLITWGLFPPILSVVSDWRAVLWYSRGCGSDIW
jgi:uncharacterized protein (DUF1810 family)